MKTRPADQTRTPNSPRFGGFSKGSLNERVTWLLTEEGKPVFVSILVGLVIGFFIHGALGLVVATIAGFGVLKRFNRLPIRMKPWQALATDLSPVLAKLLFFMIFLLPVSPCLSLSSGHTPNTLTKYLSIVVTLPKNLISGPRGNVFPGFAPIVIISMVLMFWGSLNLGKKRNWWLALSGLLLYTFSPTITSAINGYAGIRIRMSFFSIGYYCAWIGLLLVLVAKSFPRLLEVRSIPSRNTAGMFNILPPAMALGVFNQLNMADPSGHLHFLQLFDFQSVHHWLAGSFSAIFPGSGAGSMVPPVVALLDWETGHHLVAGGFSGIVAGLGAGAIVDEAGEAEETEEPEEMEEPEDPVVAGEPEAPGEPAQPEEPAPPEELKVPQGAVPSTDPEDPPGTTVQYNPDDTITKRMPDGTVATGYRDGTVYIETTDGKKTTYYPDDTVNTWSPNGTTRIDRPNGMVEITNPDGTTGIVYPDNKVAGTIIDKDGFKYTFGTDGTVSINGEIEMADGEKIAVNADEKGASVTWKDGSYVQLDPESNMVASHLKTGDGRTVETDSKNNIRIKDEKGNSANISSDGSIEYTDQDGTKVSQKHDGEVAVTTPEGAKWTAKPDGTGTVEAENGTKAILNKDGSWTVNEAGGKSMTYTPEQLKTMAGPTQPGTAQPTGSTGSESSLGGHGEGGFPKQVSKA